MTNYRFLAPLLGAVLALPLVAHAQTPVAPTKPPAPAPQATTPKATVPGTQGTPKIAPHGAPGRSHDADEDEAEVVKPRGKESTADYLWRKSDQAFHDGNYPKAIKYHNAIVAYDPTDVESYSVAAWLLWSMGKSDEALAFLNRGIKANPNDSEMWQAAGEHYELQKRSSDAKAAYAKAVELAGPKADQMLRRRLAHATEKVGDLKGSIPLWEALVRDFPGEQVNKNNLARVQALIAGQGGAVTPVAAMGVVGVGLATYLALRHRTSGARVG